MPPKTAGICDDCNTPLMQRDDDKAETVRQRLKLYHELTDALLAHYREQDLVIDVPGVGGVEVIYQNIVDALKQNRPPAA